MVGVYLNISTHWSTGQVRTMFINDLSHRDLRPMININSKIAELIGAHVGDGTLYQTSWSIVWELRGGLNEKEYYVHIQKLLFDIFNLELYPKFRSGGANGCWGVQTSKKEVTNLFLNFDFLPKSKTHTAFVPDYIFKGSLTVKRSFVRGLFDTDGCLRFGRINKNELHTYPRIEFGFASVKLRDTLYTLLLDLKFRVFVWNDTASFKLATVGTRMLERWINEIKPNNPKHLKKYQFWKENGFYKPKNM